MRNKLGLDIKVTKTLKTERKTLKALLCAGMFTMTASILLEYIGKSFLSSQFQRTIHIDYIINIFLGFTASAFISFVSLVFFYLRRKNEIIDDNKARLKSIYYIYTNMILLIKNGNKGKDFRFEYHLTTKIKYLTEKIDEAKLAYNNSEIESNKIKQIIDIFCVKIAQNLTIISIFCTNLFMLNLINKQTIDIRDEFPDSILEKEKKSTIIIKIENECYQFLVETLENNYSFDSLNQLFGTLFNSAEVLAEFNDKEMHKSLNTINQFQYISETSDLHITIFDAISSIIYKYDKYATELRVKSDIISKLITSKNISSLLNTINEINDLICKYELDAAKQLLDQLEKDVENYDCIDEATSNI